MWGPFSTDDELGYAYLNIEDATNDFYGGHRPGANLFSNSLVCIDIKTGKRIWHQQLVHHDIWDYDMPAAPILIDINVDGRPIKAVVQTGKQAFAYVFDRTNGQPVWPIPETPVKQTDVPGEWTSPTQPIPSKPPAFGQQGLKESDLIDFTPALRQEAIAALKASNLRYGDIFMPGSLANAPDGTRGTVMFFGGTNWWGGTGRSGDRLRVCQLIDVALRDRAASEHAGAECSAGESRASSIRLRYRRRRAISDGSGLEHDQAALWTNHGVRHEQRNDRVADRERRHAGERQKSSGTSGVEYSEDGQPAAGRTSGDEDVAVCRRWHESVAPRLRQEDR